VGVSARRSFDRFTVEGYAHFRLPTTTTMKTERLVSWRPAARMRDKLQDFFLGGAHRLMDMRYTAYPPADWEPDPKRRNIESSFLCKFGFVTERSGAVDVKCAVRAGAGVADSRSPFSRPRLDRSWS